MSLTVANIPVNPCKTVLVRYTYAALIALVVALLFLTFSNVVVAASIRRLC